MVEQKSRIMDIKEFVEKGFLQESNRLFFHPHGLALVVEMSSVTGEYRLACIEDFRDNPDGCGYGSASDFVNVPERALKKIESVEGQYMFHKDCRIALFGSPIQKPGMCLTAPPSTGQHGQS